MIERIERVSLVEEAYKRIKKDILSADFSEGDKIPSENALAKYLNVSRVVIREALSRLRSENFIVTYHGKGSFKANPKNFINSYESTDTLKFADFKNVTEFRYAIETAAVLAAVVAASDEELRELKDLAENMETCKTDFSAFDKVDYEFHLNMINCSHNDLFVRAFESCSKQIKRALSTMNDLNDSREFALKIHREMAEALAKRDAKTVINLMAKNSEYNLARMSELLGF